MSTSEYPATRAHGTLMGALRVRDMARRVPAETWALCALIVLAAAVRIVTIDNQSLWMDEALTAYEAHLPFGAMITTVVHVETTPPLYFIVVWCWVHVFGAGEVALRSVSTLAGIALVPVAYLAARELVCRRAALLTAAFVTVNPFLIWYSQEARSYMLLALLSAASLLWFARARANPSRRNLAWWAVCSALALMTHFFAGFLIAPEAVWLLWSARLRRTWFAVCLVGAVQVAIVPLAVGDTSHQVSWIAGVPRSHRVATAIMEWGVSLLSRRGTVTVAVAAAAILLLAVGGLLMVGGDRRSRRGALTAGGLGGFVLLAPLVLGFFGADYFLSRNEMPAFVPVAIVLAAACTVPRARRLGAALATLLLAVFSLAAVYVQTHPYLERPDWRSVAHALGPAKAPRAILVADGTTADPLKIYLPGVDWTQPRAQPVLVGEIDVVGAIKRIPVRDLSDAPVASATPVPTGRPLPRRVAPAGTWLLARVRVHNWVIARFALRTPRRLSIDRLAALAPRFYRHAPASLLVFTEPGAETSSKQAFSGR